ncbi:MAG TPA: hypothetical protein VGA95_10795 [Thermodesulfobacteriota bacterium]
MDDADWSPEVHGLPSEPCEIPEAAECFAGQEHYVGGCYSHEAAASWHRLSSELDSKNITCCSKKGGNYATRNDWSWKDGGKHGATASQGRP